MDRSPTTADTLGSAPWAPLPPPHFDRATTLPVGSWVEADLPDLYGRPVWQLRELAIDELETPEIGSDGRLPPEKRRYLDDYIERLASGEEPPPVRVLETFAGGLRLVDGHRRLAAARAAGRSTLQAWVSPLIAVPDGDGAVDLRTMTAELAETLLKPVPVTQTPEFERWFGDSKVVDSEGRPLVVYHGTTSGFDRFNPKASMGYGIYFTPNPRVANVYATGTMQEDLSLDEISEITGNTGTPVIMPVFLSIRRPLLITASEYLMGITERGVLLADRPAIERGGYDGIRVLADKEMGDELFYNDNWIAFRPSQIKSATGNRGTFDPADPRITFSRRADTESRSDDIKRSPPPTSLALADLPYDMRILLASVFDDAVVDMPEQFRVREIPVTSFPHVDGADGNTDARGADYVQAMVGADVPPVIVAGDVWLDGRHRLLAARSEGKRSVWAIDIGDVISPERAARGLHIGRVSLPGLNAAPSPRIEPPAMDLSLAHDALPAPVYRDLKLGDTTIVLRFGVPPHEGQPTVDVASVGTPTAKRRRGSARTALKSLLAAADAQGVHLRLDASPLDRRTRLDRLVGFYRSLGFVPTGRSHNYAGDPEMVRAPLSPSGDLRSVSRWADADPTEVVDEFRRRFTRASVPEWVDAARSLLPPMPVTHPMTLAELAAQLQTVPIAKARRWMRAADLEGDWSDAGRDAIAEALQAWIDEGDGDYVLPSVRREPRPGERRAVLRAQTAFADWEPLMQRVQQVECTAAEREAERAAAARLRECVSEVERSVAGLLPAGTGLGFWSFGPVAAGFDDWFDFVVEKGDADSLIAPFPIGPDDYSDAAVASAREALAIMEAQAKFNPAESRILFSRTPGETAPEGIVGNEAAAALSALREAAAHPDVEVTLVLLEPDQHATEIFGHEGPEVYIENLHSRSKGAGATVLRAIIEEADRRNVVLRGCADDNGSGRLFDHFAQFGFRRDPAGGEVLERAPSTTAAEMRSKIDGEVGNSSDAASPNPRISFSRRSAAFYSAALRTIEAARGAPRRADAAAWKGWLDGTVRRGEMRQSERDWLDIDGWLDRQPGAVTREALAAYVRASEVQLQDVVLDADARPAQEQVAERFAAAGYRIEVFNEGYPDEEVVFVDPSGEEVEIEALPPELAQAFEQARGVLQREPTFAEYTLPGGENYRELLLTLPSRRRALGDPQIEEIDRRLQAAGYEPLDDEQRAALRQASNDAVGMLEDITDRVGVDLMDLATDMVGGPVDAEFRSAHWKIPNVLVHLRMDERTYADGRRMLLLHEVQSDWHQAGRRAGYRGERTGVSSEQTRVLQALWDECVERSPRLFSGPFPGVDAAVRAIGSADVDAAMATAGLPAIDRRRVGQVVAVPDAPFKTTGDWALLAVRRAVRWAAERGFDRVGWVTGAQAASLFDLSQRIDAVRYTANADGSFTIMAYRNGARVMVEHAIEPGRLEAFIGKDLAEKIQRGEGWAIEGEGREGAREIHGDDLKVGGRGMRAFYDEILPTVVNKWGKKFGAKVGEASITTAVPGGIPRYLYVDGRRQENPAYSAEQKVHAMDITPAMRAAVLAGQPLFARAPESRPRDLGGTRVVDAAGRPRVVYRGEHGRHDGAGPQTRLPSITFVGNPEIASHYAASPNRPQDAPEAPRVLPAVLMLRNPIVHAEDDSCIDFSHIARVLGPDTAAHFARKHESRVMATAVWADDFADYPSVGALLEADASALDALYVDAYVLLDDPEFVATARAAGFDGAIHAGNGVSAGEVEYRVFDAAQVRPAWEAAPAAFLRSPVGQLGRDSVAAHADAVRARTEMLSADWPVEVRVVDTPWHLPAAVRAQRGFDPALVDAAAAYGTVYIVASKVRSDAQLQTLLAHEVVGHIGVEAVLGPARFDRVLEQIDAARTAGLHRELFAEVESRYAGMDARTQAREAIAIFAERAEPVGWLTRILAAFRRFVRDSLRLPLAFSDRDLAGLVARSARWVASGPAAADSSGPAFASAAPAPRWRSALAEAVERAQGAPREADADAWSRWLDGALRRGEYRRAERDWMGLDDWLGQQPAPLRRETLQAWVRSQVLPLGEVVHGEGASDDEIREWHDLSKSLWGALSERERGELRAQFAQTEDRPVAAASPTGYAQYRIPGGEAYRELLLTLPQTLALPEGFEARQMENGRWGVFGPGPLPENRYGAGDTREDAIRSFAGHGHTGDYKSKHWPTPNVLAHVRFDERRDARGRRVLFVHELQSDWHQAGRRHGYASPVDTRSWRAEQHVERDGVWRGLWDVYDGTGQRSSRCFSESAEAAIAKASQPPARSVPEAPFKSTGEWALLAMKRAVRAAVDAGCDRVAWATGEQVAQLFRLSQAIDAVAWSTDAEQAFVTLVGCKGTSGSDLEIYVDTASGSVHSADFGGERWIGKPLGEVIGKDLADVVLTEPRGRRAGAELDLGRAGTCAYYDQVLPNVVRSWARRFGAEVGQGKVRGEGRAWVPAHVLDITPELRAAVAAGQPMFSRGRPDDALARWFGHSRVATETGAPKVVYHGTGSDVHAFRGMVWGAEDPSLANTYAEMRGAHGEGLPNVMPLLMRVERPFDADRLPSPMTVRALADAVIEQATEAGRLQSQADREAIAERATCLLRCARREESGPYYQRHDVWHDPVAFFGRDGAQALREIFEIAGFDGISMEELGTQTWGAFGPEQAKSAIGNAGTFDPDDARVVFARTPAATDEDEESAPAPTSAGQGMGL